VRKRLRGLLFGAEFDQLELLRGLRQLVLNPARQFVLSLQLHEGVILGDLGAGVAGDLGGLDGGAADLLTPGDVGAPEGVWPEAFKVAAFGGEPPALVSRRLPAARGGRLVSVDGPSLPQ